MRKVILSGKEAMQKILEGINLVANPVKSTISPLGRTCILSESFVADYNVRNMPVTISKDGYRISKSISSDDPLVQVGVLLIQEACEKQMILAGDGTSTVALLTQVLLEGGLKLIEEGCSHIEVKRGIEAATEYVVSELKKISTPVNGNVELVKQIATTCSNGDTVIGELIAEAFSKIGADGVINIEEAKGVGTSIKISDGIKFGRGWASPYFVTNKSKQECELLDPFILIYDRPINVLKDLMPVLEQVLNSNNATGIKRPLMIFADAADGEALATLTFNNAQGNLKSCAVEMAFLGQYKRDFMEDIAAFCGGVFINELKGVKLENVKIEQLGQAKKVIVGKEETVIIDGQKDKNFYDALVVSLKKQEEKLDEGEEKDLLKKRIARLTGSVATLSIGAATEVEMKEKKDRADDACRAVRSSVEEGFIVGAGTSFLKVELPIVKEDSLLRGYNLVFDLLDEPLKQILKNAGASEDNIQSVKQAEGNIGYNAKTGTLQDLVEAGIIEPTKNNRCALQNATSVVCQILSSQYLITDTL